MQTADGRSVVSTEDLIICVWNQKMNKWCKWHQELSFFWLLVISMWSPSFLDQKTEVIFRQWTCKAGVSIRECTLCILYYICYIICMIYCYIHYIIIYVITLHHIFVIFSMHIQCMYIDIYTYIYIYTHIHGLFTNLMEPQSVLDVFQGGTSPSASQKMRPLPCLCPSSEF